MWKTSSLNPKYEVNELGQIRNKKNLNILKGTPDKDGYIIYTMTDEYGQRKDRKGHILVATEFVEGYDEIHCFVNHKNLIKNDNRASNLEWVSLQKNMEHWRSHQNFYTMVDIPIYKRSPKNNQEKCPVIQYDLNGHELARYESYMAAQRATGIRNGNISNCCRGLRHTAGGFIWRDLIDSSTTIESK